MCCGVWHRPKTDVLVQYRLQVQRVLNLGTIPSCGALHKATVALGVLGPLRATLLGLGVLGPLRAAFS